MKLAFLIPAYTDAAHLERLLASLPAESEFFLHIDAHADIAPFEAIARREPRVHFTRRVGMTWGGWSQVEAQVALIEAAMGCGEAFDYLFFMSGQDYPVWSNRRLLDYLERQGGRELIKAVNLAENEAGAGYRVYRPLNSLRLRGGSVASKVRTALRKGLWALGVRKALRIRADGRTYDLYKGSDWFGFTPRLARYVLEEWPVRRQLKRYFRTSFAPSETFIHTLVFNSPLSAQCMRYEGEQPPRLMDLSPLLYFVYKPLIRVLDESDFEAIAQAGRMRCRKLASGTSDRLVELIEQRRRAEEKNFENDENDEAKGNDEKEGTV